MFCHPASFFKSDDVTDRTPEQHIIPKTQDHWMKTTGDVCGTTQVLETVRQMFAQEECVNIDSLKSDPSTGVNDHFRNVKIEDHQPGSGGQAMTYSSKNKAIQTQINLLNPYQNNLLKLKPTWGKPDQERIDSSLKTSLNLLKPECQKISEITVKYTKTRRAEIWEPTGIVEATKTSQDPMFPPTCCFGDHICNVKENNKTQSQNQQVCLQDDTCSVPMEYKGIAFFLDSCQEAVVFDAALLEVNEIGWCEDQKQIGVRGASAVNTRQNFLMTKMKLKKILNCVVL